MLQTKTRPFTTAERERLEAELIEATTDRKPDRSSTVFGTLVGAFFGLIFGGFLAGFLSIWELPGLAALIIVGGCTAIGSAWGAYLGAKEDAKQEKQFRQYRKEYAAKLATRLGRGEIVETTVTASAVAHVTDGDEFDGYFFDIGDNLVLFVWSMDIWDDVGDEPVPSSAFSFTQYSDDSATVVHFAATGEPFAPIRKLAITGEGWSDTFYTGAVFENVSLATLENDLPYVTAAPDETDAA